jgi:MFS family permease
MTDVAFDIDRFEPSPTRRPIVTLLVANVISSLGNAITLLAIPWFVLETTGSAARTGITGAANFLPQFIAMLLGGALVDRLPRKWMSIVADCASGLTVALIPTFYYTVGLPFWLLLVLVFLGAILDTPGSSARSAITPNLARLAGMSLERANSLGSTASAVASLIGPAIGGALIALLGPRNVLYLDAASFAISALVVLVWVPNIILSHTGAERYLDDVREGFRFLRNHRLLLAIMFAAAVANFFAAPIGSVLLPVWVFDHDWSASYLGLVFSGFGGGALVGSLLFASIVQRITRRRLIIFYFAAIGLPLMLFGVTSSRFVGIALAAAAGFSLGGVQPLISTVMQERIPEHLRGRVGGATGSVSMCAAPLGVLVAGPVAEWIGVNPALIICGGMLVLVALWFWRQPVMYEMDARQV